MRICVLILLLTCFAFSYAASVSHEDARKQDERVRYDNYAVYKIKYSNRLQRQLLLQVTKRHQSVSVFKNIIETK